MISRSESSLQVKDLHTLIQALGFEDLDEVQFMTCELSQKNGRSLNLTKKIYKLTKKPTGLIEKSKYQVFNQDECVFDVDLPLGSSVRSSGDEFRDLAHVL